MINYLAYKVSVIKNLKASSLTNAVFICVIISVFCGCLVLISHYNTVLSNQLSFQETLIDRNDSSFNYLLNNLETFSYNESKSFDLFEDGLSSIAIKKHWGFYDVLICKTGFKKDTVSRLVLIGQKNIKKDPLALYVTDYDKPLKLSGATKIQGHIKIPNGKTELAYINGIKGNQVKLNGKQLKSDKKLPKIDKEINITSNYQKVLLDTLGSNPVIINPFDSNTKVLDLDGVDVLSNITCKGNLILKSNGRLRISSTAKLNDVIILAPSVHLMPGFSGNIQIVAQEEVKIDQEVSLLYPSSVYVKSKTNTAKVTINDNSTIAGGVVIDGDFSSLVENSLVLSKKASVIGNVYCYGKTQLEGEVIGSVYTDRFFLKTESSTHENVILNGVINRDSLPNYFIELPLFITKSNEKTYAIIKRF